MTLTADNKPAGDTSTALLNSPTIAPALLLLLLLLLAGETAPYRASVTGVNGGGKSNLVSSMPKSSLSHRTLLKREVFLSPLSTNAGPGTTTTL